MAPCAEKRLFLTTVSFICRAFLLVCPRQRSPPRQSPRDRQSPRRSKDCASIRKGGGGGSRRVVRRTGLWKGEKKRILSPKIPRGVLPASGNDILFHATHSKGGFFDFRSTRRVSRHPVEKPVGTGRQGFPFSRISSPILSAFDESYH